MYQPSMGLGLTSSGAILSNIPASRSRSSAGTSAEFADHAAGIAHRDASKAAHILKYVFVIEVLPVLRAVRALRRIRTGVRQKRTAPVPAPQV
jgi:hypothetical protein